MSNSPFASYIEAQKAVNANYKIMDEALAAAVMDELGYNIPTLFVHVAENGDKWEIRIDARAHLVERGHKEE